MVIGAYYKNTFKGIEDILPGWKVKGASFVRRSDPGTINMNLRELSWFIISEIKKKLYLCTQYNNCNLW